MHPAPRPQPGSPWADACARPRITIALSPRAAVVSPRRRLRRHAARDGDKSIGAATFSLATAPASLILTLSLLFGAAVVPPAPAAFTPLEDRPPPPASVGTGAIRFSASSQPGVAAVQNALVEAWAAARADFVEAGAVSGPAWEAALQAALGEAGAASDAAMAWGVVERLIASLGDQYTRVLRPGSGDGYGGGSASLYAADLAGQATSLGLQLVAAGAGGNAAVVSVGAVIPGSPAEAAGVRPDDEVVAVNGRPAAATPPTDLARALAVDADVQVRSGSGSVRTYHLTPAVVPLHAVQHASLAGRDGRKRVAYLRLAAFNDLTPDDVRASLAALALVPTQPSALIIDLRDNAGGAVAAAVNVAGQLLEGGGGSGSLLARVQDGRGSEEAVAVPRPPRASRPPWPQAGRPLMALLINGGTASSSELLAGALAGGDTATVLTVGERSFGKGRTQRSVPLTGGGLLLISNRTFTTPAGVAVDGVGLTPAVKCVPDVATAGFFVSGGTEMAEGGDAVLADSLLSDPCVRLAAERLGVELREAVSVP